MTSVSVLAWHIVGTQSVVAGFHSGRKGEPCFLRGKEAGLLRVWGRKDRACWALGAGGGVGVEPLAGASMSDCLGLPGSLLPNRVEITVPSRCYSARDCRFHLG